MIDVTDIRNPLDLQRLDAFFLKMPSNVVHGSQLPILTGPFTVNQFLGGQSNPTYLLQDSKGEFLVLRRKPMSNAKLVLKSAHAIEREFYILNAIATCNATTTERRKVPVPLAYTLCEDESVLGAVFYVMEFVEGRTIKDLEMNGANPTIRAQIWESIMSTISAIHSLDSRKLIKQLPAQHFPHLHQQEPDPGRKKLTYFQRQIKTLTRVAELQSKTVDSIPNFDIISRWTLDHAPADPEELTLTHGDCKIDNFLFHPTEPRVIAVLDWELCTFGHPLFDLANFLQPYALPQELNDKLWGSGERKRQLRTASEDVQKLLYLYQEKLGHAWKKDDFRNNPLDTWKTGVVFGLLRLCVIAQGVAMRVSKGVASSAAATSYSEVCKSLSEIAMSEINLAHGQKL